MRIDNRKGFTLVELALVLVIVGLLITGVLKGEALIQNAKVKRLVSEKESISAAFYTFYDRYGQYPGDQNLANVPTSADTVKGNANGLIQNNGGGTNEITDLFQDLALAQIINGNYDGTTPPKNTFGGTIAIQYVGTPAGIGGSAVNANCSVLTLIPPDVAAQVDRKYDDGVEGTGTIRSNAAYTGTANVTLYWRL